MGYGVFMSEPGNGRIRHPIGMVSQRTGLSAAALRAWERRYGAVEPLRSAGGQRLYSDDDVRRLALLKRLVDGGRSISQVANLSEDELRRLAIEDRRPGGRLSLEAEAATTDAERAGERPQLFLDRAIEAVERMDAEALERTLVRAAVLLQPDRLLGEVVLPLLTRIGALWEHERLGAAQEHVASGVVRRFLEWLVDTAEVEPGAPLLITGTPQSQRHEFGALVAGAVATGLGWRTVFLGPDLPAEEIASAATRLQARAVALSALHPEGRTEVASELRRLRDLLPAQIRIYLGGPAEAIADAEGIPGTTSLPSFEAFEERLRDEGAA
jgi:MerR family transcriptional regulator, light-induced transcriptional regulator